MSDKKSIGVKIRDIRKAQGLTQTQLAQRLGLTQQAIQRIEKGVYSTGIDTLCKIADALGKNIDFV